MQEQRLYLILLENSKPLTGAAIEGHAAHLRALDEAGRLVVCGPFTDYPGGMVLIRAGSLEEAHATAKNDPFVSGGYKTYSIRTLGWANKENNYGV